MTNFKSIIFSIGANGHFYERPLGAHRISSFLREHGWDCEVVDHTQYWSLSQLISFSKSRITKDTKFIGFSMMFINQDLFPVEYVIWLKSEYPDIKIIVGGQFIFPYSHHLIDYILYGYAEHSIFTLLKFLFSNGKPPIFTKISSNLKIIDGTTEYKTHESLKDLMVKYEKRDFLTPVDMLGIEFSRGCKFACSFCNYPILGVKSDTSRDKEDYRTQVNDAYDNFGIQRYIIIDETFNDRIEKVRKFADVTEELDFDMLFHRAFIRADLLINRPDDRIELSRMGVNRHFYGIETFNHESGKSVGKGMHPDKIMSGLLDIKNYFYNNGTKRYLSEISLIFGLPHETKESIMQSIHWLSENWKDQLTCSSLLLIPISEYEKRSKLTIDHEKYNYRKSNFTGDVDHITGIKNFSDLYLAWENDHMNFVEANAFSSTLFSEVGYKANYDDIPESTSLAYTPESHIEEYIYNKISWRYS